MTEFGWRQIDKLTGEHLMASVHLDMELKADGALPLFHELAQFSPAVLTLPKGLLFVVRHVAEHETLLWVHNL